MTVNDMFLDTKNKYCIKHFLYYACFPQINIQKTDVQVQILKQKKKKKSQLNWDSMQPMKQESALTTHKCNHHCPVDFYLTTTKFDWKAFTCITQIIGNFSTPKKCCTNQFLRQTNYCKAKLTRLKIGI